MESGAVKSVSSMQAARLEWTSARIKSLRGNRTQEEFGKVLRVPKNTVWRWEAGYARPDAERVRRLAELAAKERPSSPWQIEGSAVLLGDLEAASSHLARHFKLSPKLIALKLR